MDTSSAVEKVRDRLEQTFGKALAMLILASASNEAGCTTVGISPPEYTRLIEAISRDQRVIDMWGAAGAADALASWRASIAG
ncbi:MAG: hypothetical protein HY876_05395 [Coriobacteriales bacterium]|nr:hypothetical protein [Coriobacteriales bacterium]